MINRGEREHIRHKHISHAPGPPPVPAPPHPLWPWRLGAPWRAFRLRPGLEARHGAAGLCGGGVPAVHAAGEAAAQGAAGGPAGGPNEVVGRDLFVVPPLSHGEAGCLKLLTSAEIRSFRL